MRVIVADNHCHVNPVHGIGPRNLAKKFLREGGKILVIVSLLTWSLDLPPCEITSFEKLYKMTIRACKEISEEGVHTLCILGIHPAEIHQMILKGWNIEKILNFVDCCMKLIENHIKSGEAHGIGEVGRPHWDVPEEEWRIHNIVLERCLEYAKDLDVPVHLHLERKGLETVKSIANIVNKVGNRKYSVVLHHAEGTVVKEAFDAGLMPSVPVGRKQDFEQALQKDPVYVVESDYLDDPKRPGAVIAPWALVRKVRSLVESKLRGPEYVRKIAIDNLHLVYGDVVKIEE